MRTTTVLRKRLEQDETLIAVGAYDALSARLIEMEGGEVVYLGGFVLSASRLAQPDMGIATLTDLVAHSFSIASAVSLPVLVDGEAGFGGRVNVARTVQQLERAGVAGLHIEDLTFGKHLGGGGTCLAKEEMVKRIKIALEAREDDDFVVIARTDARWAHRSLDEAIERGRAYAEAGAHAVFIASIPTDEIPQAADAIPVPLMVTNFPFTRRQQLLSNEELSTLGAKVVLYAAEPFLAVCETARQVVEEILKRGGTKSIFHRLATLDAIGRLVGVEDMKKLLEE